MPLQERARTVVKWKQQQVCTCRMVKRGLLLLLLLVLQGFCEQYAGMAVSAHG
jgi:hypothetical protein